MDNLVVVYMDASLYKVNKDEACIGLGIYMVDKNGNDTKISKGFKSEKIKKSNTAELCNLIGFEQYVSNNINYIGKEFIIYADSEQVVDLLNDKDNLKNFGLKKNIRKKINDLNIKGAYWVKGHAKEKGNNFVDVLAYNGMREALDNNSDFESITHNKKIDDIFINVRRAEKYYYLENISIKEFNKELYFRAFEEDKNVTKKFDSDHYQNKNNLIDKEDYYLAEIGGAEDGCYSINEKEYKNASLKNIFENLFLNNTILKEKNKESKNILIKFKDELLSEKFIQIYTDAKILFEENKEIGIYKKESKEKFKEIQKIMNEKIENFTSQSNLHLYAFRFSRNDVFIIDGNKKIKNTLKM